MPSLFGFLSMCPAAGRASKHEAVDGPRRSALRASRLARARTSA